ncbi:hypothetical protein D3C87_1403650 [compost metagenome]
MLLQIVTLARDVRDHFALIGQANLGNLTQSRVRLLRGRGVHTGANAALLRIGFHGRNFVPLWLAGAWLADQLINGGHCALSIVQILVPLTCERPLVLVCRVPRRDRHSSVYTSKPKRRLPDPMQGFGSASVAADHPPFGSSHAHKDLLRLATRQCV